MEKYLGIKSNEWLLEDNKKKTIERIDEYFQSIRDSEITNELINIYYNLTTAIEYIEAYINAEDNERTIDHLKDCIDCLKPNSGNFYCLKELISLIGDLGTFAEMRECFEKRIEHTKDIEEIRESK